MVSGPKRVVEIRTRGPGRLEPPSTTSGDGVDHTTIIDDPTSTDGPGPLVTVNVPVENQIDAMAIIELGQRPDAKIAAPPLPPPGVSIIVLV
tara:strand:- start:26 stop:301 length:276 start_codon:yes stop_codon:yes gene_type:complete